MDRFKIINGDNRIELKNLDDNSIDSIVCDPPYELGFMGKKWDASGIAYDVSLWKECLRVLKPGGHLLAFGGTRTFHRLFSAIEDAGFELKDCIMYCYGSGFPKSHNIGKAIDKELGNEREVIRERTHRNSIGSNEGYKRPEDNYKIGKMIKITKGSSEWEGWGTALKPAYEPIIMAKKPISEKNIALNVLKYGTGGINIDDCRVGDDVIKTNSKLKGQSFQCISGFNGCNENLHTGRWPANFIHDGSEEVLDLLPNNSDRFFYCAKTSKKDRNEGCQDLEEKNDIRVNAPRSNENEKFSTSYKNNHPTVKPTELMRYLVRLVTPKDGTVLDPFCGSGSTGKACMLEGFNFIGIELNEEYCIISKKRILHALNLSKKDEVEEGKEEPDVE